MKKIADHVVELSEVDTEQALLDWIKETAPEHASITADGIGSYEAWGRQYNDKSKPYVDFEEFTFAVDVTSTIPAPASRTALSDLSDDYSNRDSLSGRCAVNNDFHPSNGGYNELEFEWTCRFVTVLEVGEKIYLLYEVKETT